MTRSVTPDFTGLAVPRDAWTAPFWEGAAAHRLLMPRCVACGTFRWPAGPFCPSCHAQPVDWVPPGAASLYAFTILLGIDPAAAPRVPVVAAFADAPGVRLMSVLIDAAPGNIAIGVPLQAEWLPAADAVICAFRLAEPGGR